MPNIGIFSQPGAHFNRRTRVISYDFGTGGAISAAGPASFQLLNIGGGGYSTGLVSHAASGKLATRIDVYGAYILDSGATKWRQLATSTSMPADYQGTPFLDGGVYDLAFDPTDASGNTLYMYYCPFLGGGPALSTVLKTTDGGSTFALTGFPLNSQNANTSGVDRETSGSMGVDPANGNVVYVGIQANLYRSLDAGASFATVASVPAANVSHGICGIAFDPTSGTTTLSGQTVTARVLVASASNGVYESTNGGSTFALITGSPTNVSRHAMGSDGNYYVSPGGGTMTRITPADVVTAVVTGGSVCGIALDPVNPAHAYCTQLDGTMMTFAASIATGTTTISYNANVTSILGDAGWQGLIGHPTIAFTAGNCVWDQLLTTSASSMTIGNATFTPTVGANQNIAVNDVLRFYNTGTLTNWMLGKVSAYNPGTGALTMVVGGVASGGFAGAATGGSGTFSAWTVIKERVWISTGTGMFYVDAPIPTSAAYTVVGLNHGIESLQNYNVVAAPGGPWGLASEDTAQFFPIASDPRLRTGAPGRGPAALTGTTVEGGRCDVAINDSTYWVASTSLIAVGAGPIFSGFSTNSGVVGDATNSNTSSWQLWPTIAPVHGYIKCATPTNTVIAGYAGAVRYTTNGGTTWSTPVGSPATVPGNWNFNTPDCLAKDWVNSGTFYVTDGAHVFRSTDGGANWTQRAAVTSTSFLLQLRSVPGQAGHLFFTAGARPDSRVTSSFAAFKANHPVAGSSLFFSNDGGGTFTLVPNTAEAICVGFSATPPGGSYPCVLFAGWLSGVYGLWECSAFNPANLVGLTWVNLGSPLTISQPTYIEGSQNTPHLYVIGFGNGNGYEVYGPPGVWP